MDELLRAAPNATILVAQIIPAGHLAPPVVEGLPTWVIAQIAWGGVVLMLMIGLAVTYRLKEWRRRRPQAQPQGQRVEVQVGQGDSESDCTPDKGAEPQSA